MCTFSGQPLTLVVNGRCNHVTMCHNSLAEQVSWACRCIIQRDGTDSQKLPTAHTCFNTLLLPSYRSREVMSERLRLAIMNSEGFGLE